MKRMLTGLLVLLALYLCLIAALFIFQRSILYFPVPRTIIAPESTMHLPVDGADVIVTTRAHVGPRALIYFGGNADDVSENLPIFQQAFPDYAIYLMSYRGYGGSSGSPSEAANFADAALLYQRVRAEHSDIAIMGRSLGSGIAVHLASQVPASHLVLITPYDSIVAVAQSQYWYVPALRLLLHDKYDSFKYAASIKTPTVILEAENDQVIPHSSTEHLLASFPPGIATMTVIRNRGHNDIGLDAQYLKVLQDTLN